MKPTRDKRAARAGAAVAVAALAATLAPVDVAPAGAQQDHGTRSVWKLGNGANVIQAQGTYRHRPNNLTQWSGVRSAETTPVPGSVCNYQGWMGEISPSGNLVFQQYSSHHAGCSFVMAWFDWPGWNMHTLRGTRLRAKWHSDTTPGAGWMLIGDLRD